MSGTFVISLDFELLWGVRDHADRNSYGQNILGGRKAIPRILDLFSRHGIRATWATVGFVFCESRDELMDCLPPEELRPRYVNGGLSNYGYLSEVGQDEVADPLYFGGSLVRRISAAPGQEIGTHTLSHCYCLEEGFTAEVFEADLNAADRLARSRGITLSSIVFPRNQYGDVHIGICTAAGLTAYRGNPGSWAYRPSGSADQGLLRRGMRLADAYSGVLGPHLMRATPFGSIQDVPASRFLRPQAGRLARLHPLHVGTICREMTRAARLGEGYHLWWHPHNFGRNTEECLEALKRILEHFRTLEGEYGMRSRAMRDFR